MSAAEKILRIQQELVVEKSGYDERNEYYYYRAEDVAKAVRNKMNEVGLIHRTEITEWAEDNKWDSSGRNRPRVTFKAAVIFVDPEDNSTFATEVIATGSDTGGDKSTRKAQVQAFKIAAIDLFVITEEQEKFDSDGDPESEPISTAEPVEDEETVKSVTKEISAIVNDEDNPITGQNVGAIGKRIAQEVHGKEIPAATWKKDLQVIKAVLKAIQNGEVE